MTIKPADGHIGINFNIETFYEDYEKGRDYSEIRHGIADLAARALDNAPEVNTAVLTDYEQMKNKLSVEVISKKGNEAFLENIPHKDLEDMAVYYRFVLDVHSNGEMQSITVTNNMLENYGITADQLHEDAMLSEVLEVHKERNCVMIMSGDYPKSTFLETMQYLSKGLHGGNNTVIYGVVHRPEQENYRFTCIEF